MLLEVIGFVGAVIVLLFFFAEQRKPFLGFSASIMLMVLSFWILADGIQVRSGELKTIANLENMTGNSTAQTNGVNTVVAGIITAYTATTTEDVESLTNITGTETLQYAYTDVPVTPFAETHQFIGLMLLLISLYGMFHYVATFMAK